MHGEQSRYRHAASNLTRGRLQEQKQEHDAQSVQQEIVIVVSGCLQMEQLKIESVRQPGKRMPIGCVGAEKSPAYRLPRETALHVAVSGHICRIIEVDESHASRSEERRV